MKIGILSDTHTMVQKAKEAIDMLLNEGAEFFIHAGDIVEIEVLEILKKSGVRYIAVYGNNDAHLASYHTKYNLVQEPHHFKLADTQFKLMHLPYYLNADSEVVIFGHTHEFSVEFTIHGTLFLNPGESCARNTNVSECAMLEVTNREFLITHFTKKEEDSKFQNEKFFYTRIKK